MHLKTFCWRWDRILSVLERTVDLRRERESAGPGSWCFVHVGGRAVKSLIRKLTCCEEELLENHLIRDWEHSSLYTQTQWLTFLCSVSLCLTWCMSMLKRVFNNPPWHKCQPHGCAREKVRGSTDSSYRNHQWIKCKSFSLQVVDQPNDMAKNRGDIFLLIWWTWALQLVWVRVHCPAHWCKGVGWSQH